MKLVLALFKIGEFISSAGRKLRYKIECDALNPLDIETLALLIRDEFTFSKVISVPTGGDQLALCLEKYCSGTGGVLVVDDVLTTGSSIQEVMSDHPDSVGVVIFARGECPPGVHAIFHVSEWAR